MTNKPFTFSKSQDDNIPDNAKNSDYWDEPKNNYPQHDEDDEIVEDEVEVPYHDDSIIDRSFIVNRDLSDEHYPDNEL